MILSIETPPAIAGFFRFPPYLLLAGLSEESYQCVMVVKGVLQKPTDKQYFLQCCGESP